MTKELEELYIKIIDAGLDVEDAIAAAYQAGQANPKVEWIKIDGVDSLPTITFNGHWRRKGDGYETIRLYEPTYRDYFAANFTHYCKVVMPAPPEDV